MGNELFDLEAGLQVGLEVISFVVGARGFNFSAIVGDKHLAHGVGVWGLLRITALRPERTTTALGSGETKAATITGLGRISDR